MDVERILVEELDEYGLRISSDIQEQLCIFAHELIHWNRAINLTSLRDIPLVRRLIVEPIYIGQKLQMSGGVADVGSGNGSPGIPIYLSCDLSSLHLVEVRSRRVAFLRHVATKIRGTSVFVHRSRIEELEEIGNVDWITLQALAPSASMIKSMRDRFQPTTRVVWITARREAPTHSAVRICVRNSESEAWVFQLDQF